MGKLRPGGAREQPERAVTQMRQEPTPLAWAQCPQLPLALATEDGAWEEPDPSLPAVRPAQHTGHQERRCFGASGRDLVNSHLGHWEDRPLSVSLRQGR